MPTAWDARKLPIFTLRAIAVDDFNKYVAKYSGKFR
jgi:hypothetical protein